MIKILKNSFIKKIAIYSIGTLSTNLINLLLVPIYAYCVAPSDSGNYDYIISLSDVIATIVFIVLWEAILKFCLDKKNDTSAIITNVFYIIGKMLICFFAVSIVYSLIVKNNKIIIMVLCSTILKGFSSIWQYSSRALGKNKEYVWSGFISSIITISIDVLFIILFKLNYVALFFSHLLSQLSIVIFLENKIHLLRKVDTSKIDRKRINQILTFTLPLMFNNICLWFYSGGNKIIIKNYLGAEESGLFSFAYRFCILINICGTIISMSLIEEVYSYNSIDEYRIKISKLISIVSKAYFSITVLAIPIIYIIYSIFFFNTPYFSSAKYIYLLLLSSLFTALSNNFGSAFQVVGKTKLIFITTIIGAASTLSISLFTVSSLSVWGIVIGSVLGPAIMMCLRAIYAKKSTGLSINWSSNVVLLIYGLIMNCILITRDSLMIKIAMLFLTIVLVSILYKKEIITFINRKTNETLHH